MLLVIVVDDSELNMRSGELSKVENSQWHCQKKKFLSFFPLFSPSFIVLFVGIVEIW